MTDKERFIEIFKTEIQREGSGALLDYLLSPQSDFFTAPASSRFHNNFPGGLLNHSLNVYDCLCDILENDRVLRSMDLNVSKETAAITALLHDLCKVNFYKESTRNVKDENGVWQRCRTMR